MDRSRDISGEIGAAIGERAGMRLFLRPSFLGVNRRNDDGRSESENSGLASGSRSMVDGEQG